MLRENQFAFIRKGGIWTKKVLEYNRFLLYNKLDYSLKEGTLFWQWRI